MVFIVLGSLISILSLISAAILFFRLPLWEQLAGISRLSPEKRSKIRIKALVPTLASFFALFGLCFASLSILYLQKNITDSIFLRSALIACLIIFNTFTFCFRFFNKNPQNNNARFISLIFQLTISLGIIYLFFNI